MLGRFPRLSKIATKILEITGAACASAVAAVVLGNLREPQREVAPPPVVRLAPADEQMIKHVREENVALAEQLRSAADAHHAAAGAPAPNAAAPAAKPAKAATAAPARREQKATREANRAQPTDARQRPAEAPPMQSARLSPAPEPARVPAAGATVGAATSSDARDGRTTPAVAVVVAPPPALAAPAPAAVAPAAASEASQSSTQTEVPSRLFPAVASSLRDAPRPPREVGEYPANVTYPASELYPSSLYPSSSM